MKFKTLVLGALALGLSSASQAQNLFVNGSFEAAVLPVGSSRNFSVLVAPETPEGWLPGWSFLSPAPNITLYDAGAQTIGWLDPTEGNQYISLGQGVSIQQTFSFVAGTTYQFSVDAGSAASSPSIGVSFTPVTGGIPLEFVFLVERNNYGTYEQSFTIETSGDYLFSLTATNRAIYIDNLILTAVPEPSAYAALFGFGALGFVVLRRRSRRSR